MSYSIKQHDDNPSLKDLLFNGINKEAFKAKKLPPIESFGFSVIDPKDNVLGGMTGVTYYGCLYIDMLWIDSSHRKQGIGTKLMLAAEALGKQKNCSFATVNTMDWEALSFYQKLGYSIEFSRDGYQKNSKLFLLRKSL